MTTLRKNFGGGRGAGLQPMPGLNLTPMIDVMTILLIFLVKAYSVSPEYLAPPANVKLSVTSSDSPAPNKTVLVINKDGVAVDGQVIVPFSKGQPNPGLLREATIPALERALIASAKRAHIEQPDTLIIEGDRGLPFDYMKPILRTAGAAGFHDIKFAGMFEE